MAKRSWRAKAGIVGWKTGDNSFGSTLSYLHFLTNIGCEVIILTPLQGIVPDLDLVLMPGGKDMSPTLYGQLPGFYNSDADQFKEAFLKNNLDQYIEAGIPVLGICLGFQQLVVKFGGKLHQHLYGHDTSDPEERSELVNTLIVAPKYQKLAAELTAGRGKKTKELKCCSLHHQGALESDVDTDQFEIIATAKEGGYLNNKVVEIVRHVSLPILGVQMHPEEDWNALALHFIEELIIKSPHNHGSKETLSGVAEEAL